MLKDIRTEVLSIKNYKDPENPSFYDIELENFREIETKHVMPEAVHIGNLFLKVTDMIKISEEEAKDEVVSVFEREDGSETFTLIVKKETQEPLNYRSWDYVIEAEDRNYTGVFTYIPEDEENPSFKKAKTYKFSGTLPVADKNRLKEGMRDEEFFKGKASRFYRDDYSYYLALSALIKSVNEEEEEIIYEIKDSKLAVYADNDDVSDMKRVEPEFIVVDVDLKDYRLKGMFNFFNFRRSLQEKKNGGYFPEITKFSGELKAFKTGSSFKGDLQLRLKNIKEMDLENSKRSLFETKLSGELYLKDRDKILITLYSDELERDKFYNEISYTFQNKTIFISGDMERENKILNWDLTIRNQNGVSMKVIGNEAGRFEGEVERNGKSIGTFETLNDLPIVRYKDGTFESIP